MSNFILSAELVLKDKMTAGLKKTGYALSGIAGEALKLTYSPCLKAGDSWIQTILAY